MSDLLKNISFPFAPVHCPICGDKLGPARVLVCNKCWWEVPTYDRVGFHRLYTRDPNSSVSKAEKIIRNLKAAHAKKNQDDRISPP